MRGSNGKDHTRVGIWLRVSTEDQVKGESPEHHERRARSYAEGKGWEVVEVYRLDAVSGKSVMDRPETKKMLDNIRSGHISALIFSKLARLARNTKELLEFADIFRDANADLVSLHESIDTTTPAGRFFYTMVAGMAQWEREEIAERVAASVPVRAKMGKPLNGQSPFGYRWQDHRLVPDPEEAPIRRRMYELFSEHQRKKTVADLLNQAGFRTRNGSLFSDTTVVRLLRDPTAKGLRLANYTKSLGTDKKWVLKPEQEWVYSPVEPVVEEELWTTCNRILDDQLHGRKRPGRRPVHLFAGLIVCICGKKMYVPANTPKYVCFNCRNKISVEDLNAIYYEQLKDFFLSPTDIADYLSRADETLKEKEALLTTLEANEKSIREEMDRLYDLYIHGEIPRQGFGERYTPLQNRLNQIDDEIPRVRAEIDLIKINYLSGEQILMEASSLYKQWPNLALNDRRRIVEAITESIVVGKGEITIDFCYHPYSEDMAKSPHSMATACAGSSKG